MRFVCLRTLATFLIIFNLALPYGYAGFQVAPVKQYKLSNSIPQSSVPAFTPAATAVTQPSSTSNSNPAPSQPQSSWSKTYPLQNRPAQTPAPAVRPAPAPAIQPRSSVAPAPAAARTTSNPQRSTPLLDRQRAASAVPAATPAPQPVSRPSAVPAAVEVTAERPVTLIKAFRNPVYLPGPRSQDSPSDIAASLAQLTPSQQAARVNSLSAYDAARVLTCLDQDQIDQLMSQPDLDPGLLGRVQQFITPGSYASLTGKLDPGRLVASLQSPDLTPAGRAQILESAPQATGALGSLLQTNSPEAGQIFDALTGNKQAEIISQLDAVGAAKLLAGKEYQDLFAGLSPDQQSGILGEMLAIDPAMAQRYLQTSTRSLTNEAPAIELQRLSSDTLKSADHPALLVNGMSESQLKTLLGASPAIMAEVLTDVKLDPQTRDRIINVFKKEVSDATVSGYLISANPAVVSSSSYGLNSALNIYASLDPEGYQALIETLAPAYAENLKTRQEFVLSQLTGLDLSAAGALLAKSDITAAQTAALLLAAAPEQREKILSALEKTDPAKARQTQAMVSQLEEDSARAQETKARQEEVRAEIEQVGPQKVADWLAQNHTQEDVNSLGLMDQGFIDQTLSFLEKGSPEAAKTVRGLLANTRETPSTMEEQYDLLLKQTPQKVALIVAMQTPDVARLLVTGLKEKDAAFTAQALTAMEGLDYQLAQEMRKETPDQPREVFNQNGRIIKIDGDQVYSKRGLADGSVYYSKIGILGDSPDTTELAEGESIPDPAPVRLRTSTKVTTDSYTPQGAWYDPVNGVFGDQYGVYSADPNQAGIWKQKQTVIIMDGTRVQTPDAVTLDPVTGFPPLGTMFYNDSGDRTFILKTVGTLDNKKVAGVYEVKTFKAGEKVTIPMVDGTTSTYTAAQTFTLWPDSKGGYDLQSAALVDKDGNGVKFLADKTMVPVDTQ